MALRASRSSSAITMEAAKGAPGADCVERSAVVIAATTGLGVCMPMPASMWIQPSPRAGISPRTRATSYAIPIR